MSSNLMKQTLFVFLLKQKYMSSIVLYSGEQGSRGGESVFLLMLLSQPFKLWVLFYVKSARKRKGTGDIGYSSVVRTSEFKPQEPGFDPLVGAG